LLTVLPSLWGFPSTAQPRPGQMWSKTHGIMAFCKLCGKSRSDAYISTFLHELSLRGSTEVIVPNYLEWWAPNTGFCRPSTKFNLRSASFLPISNIGTLSIIKVCHFYSSCICVFIKCSLRRPWEAGCRTFSLASDVCRSGSKYNNSIVNCPDSAQSWQRPLFSHRYV